MASLHERMPKGTREAEDGMFRCCGENAFTFLFFQAISRGNLVRPILLPSLRQFGTGHRLSEPVRNEEEPDVWLFPNFGRKRGFGEPDALVLVGERSFWFEVETRLDIQFRLTAAKQSLLQLARFHFFQEALTRGPKVRLAGIRHRAIVGPTIGNNRRVKDAVLKIKNHPVLQKICSRLAKSTPHYVLCSQREPRGRGAAERFEVAMQRILQDVVVELSGTFEQWGAETGSDIPSMPLPERFWYTYWNGQMEQRFSERQIPNPLAVAGYVGIRNR